MLEAAGDASPCGDCESSIASGCALACGSLSRARWVASLKSPAMTMAFEMKDKSLLDKVEGR